MCFNKIDPEIKQLIISSIQTGSINNELKRSLLHYINYNNITASIIYEAINKKNNILDYEKELYLRIDDSIDGLLNGYYDINKIKFYNENNSKLKSIIASIEKYTIKDTSRDEVLQFIKSKLKQHNSYKTTDLQIKITKGKLEIKNSPIEFESMSKSEQNYFKILYFDILIYQKVKEGKINVIIDDPFDSYDDIFIKDSINVIVNFIYSNMDNIKYCQIFSHSSFIMNLYRDIMVKLTGQHRFSLKWLDNDKFTSDVTAYNDKYCSLKKIDYQIADFGFAIKLIEKFIDYNSLIVASTILRNEASLTNKITIGSESDVIKDASSMFKKFYDFVSENIIHTRNKCTLHELYYQFKMVYSTIYIEDENKDKTIDCILDILDYKNINSITVISKTGSGVFENVEINDVSHLFIFKYLLGLKIRRSFELKCKERIKGEYHYIIINDLLKLLDNERDNDLLKYFNCNSELMDSFCHSSTRVIPPILVYSLCTLQEKYVELESIKSS